jgi:hypothetical protein
MSEQTPEDIAMTLIIGWAIKNAYDLAKYPEGAVCTLDDSLKGIWDAGYAAGFAAGVQDEID